MSKDRELKLARNSLVAAVLTAASAICYYPVSYSALLSYITPNAWYRINCTINFFALFWMCSVLSAELPRLLRSGLVLFVVLMLVFGAFRTRTAWQMQDAPLRTEGQFYVANETKLLYSELNCPWFLSGLDLLYNISKRHWVRPSDSPTEILSRFDTVYVRKGSEIVRDDELFRSLTARQ